VIAAAERLRNDEIRMSKPETIPNNQMIKRFHHPLSDFVLRHSFVIRHSCFVIFLALSVTPLFAEKRALTEKDLWSRSVAAK